VGIGGNAMTLDEAARYAPLVTATVAVLAFVSAAYGIWSQRSIARKRAALDLFLKTELDKAMVDAYDKYMQGVKVLKNDTDMRNSVGRVSMDILGLLSTFTSLSRLACTTGCLIRRCALSFGQTN
jgi:hypothetical protein